MSRTPALRILLLAGLALAILVPALGTSKSTDKKTKAKATPTAVQVTLTPTVTQAKKVDLPEFYLAETKGDVKVVHKGIKGRATAPQAVQKDDRILTGKDGYAYLQFKSGGTIELSPKSDVTVKEMEADSKTLKARFKMAAGRMRTILKKLTSSKSTFEIEAGGVVCGVRGTTFEVDYDKDKKNVATKTYEGSVWAKVKGKETVVDKGFGFLVGDKGDPVLGALSSEEMKDALEFIKISDDLDSRKDLIQKKLEKTLLGTLMGGDASVDKAMDDAKAKLPFSF